jgi:long-chain acyl-CoA synthetase
MAAGGWPTIGSLVQRAERLWGGREAVVDGERRLTYRALCAWATRLGSGLRGLGLAPGERVAFLGDNSLEFLVAYLGIPTAGLVLLPLNARLAAEEIRYILDDAGCAMLIVGRGYEERATRACAGANVRLIACGPEPLGDVTYDALIERGREGVPREAAAADDLAYLYYTSGTTGRPKGVMLSHANVLAGALSGCAALDLTGGATWLHAGPMFHLADAFAIWAFTWLGGRHVAARFDPQAAVRAIVEEGVTHTLMVPTAVSLLLDAAEARGQRLERVRGLLYGGAAMPPGLYQRAREALACPLVGTYGTTETSGLCTVLAADEHEDAESGVSRVESVGKDVPLLDLALLDDAGQPVAAGAIGEVVASGPAVMLGYWNAPEQTAEVLRDGALRTGDVARRDADGYLYLVDRKKDLIISGGENVYALEVERVLSQHPAVHEIAVVGRPDPRWGETVCAVVRAAPGQTVTLDALRRFGREHLAGYKLPRVLRLVDGLPRTGSGKVNKAALRQAMRDGGAAAEESR